MDDRFTYDSDFLIWTEKQAQALRALAKSRADLPNELDLEHVAEEIEDMGRSELNAVKSQIRNILVHLIKSASTPHSSAIRHWRTEIVGFHLEVLDHVTPAMRHRLGLDSVWRQALRKADVDLQEFDETVMGGLEGPCPIEIDDLLGAELAIDALVSRLIALATRAPVG